MTPTIEISEWAEELGIKGARGGYWEWLGNMAVPDRAPLRFVCPCRVPSLASMEEKGVPTGDLVLEEINMMRLAESEYLVGQCEICLKIVWTRAEVH